MEDKVETSNQESYNAGFEDAKTGIVDAFKERQVAVQEIFEEIEKLFADEDGVHTFIRSRDDKTGVENCKLIITKEWQALKQKWSKK